MTDLLPPMELYEDQRKAVDFILEHKHALLKAGTGAGKTVVGVQSALESGADIILAVVPINTFSGWRRTVERQYQGTMPFHVITSKVAGQRAHGALLEGTPGFYVIGREYFRRFGWSKLKADFIIYDEVHGISNRDSLNFKMAKTAKAPYKLGLSATPAGNKIQGLWSVGRWLWPDKVERGYWNFITEFFHTEKNPHAKDERFASPIVTVERNPGAVWASLPAAYKMKSVYRADPAIHTIEVDLTREQRKHYKDLEQEAITWLDDNPLAVDIPAVLYIRLQQVTLAVPSIKQGWVRKQDKDTGDWEKEWGDILYFEDDAKSSKIDAVFDVLSDLHAGEEKPAVIIYTHSRLFATILTKRLQAKDYRARQFIGGMSQEERDWKLDNFGTEYEIMVAVIAAIGEGTDGIQHKCNHEIWCSYSDSGILNEQAEGRLSRTGQTKTVNRYLIQAKDTLETTKQLGRLSLNKEALTAGMGD